MDKSTWNPSLTFYPIANNPLHLFSHSQTDDTMHDDDQTGIEEELNHVNGKVRKLNIKPTSHIPIWESSNMAFKENQGEWASPIPSAWTIPRVRPLGETLNSPSPYHPEYQHHPVTESTRYPNSSYVNHTLSSNVQPATTPRPNNNIHHEKTDLAKATPPHPPSRYTNKVTVFQKREKPVPVHPSREPILRNSLRHLFFARVNPPTRQCSDAQKIVARAELTLGQVSSSISLCREAMVLEKVAGQESRRAELERLHIAEEERRDIGRNVCKTNTNTQSGFSSHETELTPAPTGASPVSQGVGHVKQTQYEKIQRIAAAPSHEFKRVKAVTLAAATQWASELGTFEYLQQTGKTDGETSKRLAKLLDQIDQQKRGTSSELLKQTQLVKKLRPFLNRDSFSWECREKARRILEFWVT